MLYMVLRMAGGGGRRGRRRCCRRTRASPMPFTGRRVVMCSQGRPLMPLVDDGGRALTSEAEPACSLGPVNCRAFLTPVRDCTGLYKLFTRAGEQ